MTADRPKNSSARWVALSVLNKFDTVRHDAQTLLHEMIDRTDRKAQATDLVYGVIRNMGVLDMVIARASKTSVERIERKLLNILRIGAYELVFSPQTAGYAIVNEAANLAGDAGGRKQAGFVNAVLRNLVRSIDQRTTDLAGADVRRIIPQSPKTGCLFADKVLPDPKNEPEKYLAEVFSIPGWLIEGWVGEFGFAGAGEICLASNRRPGVFVRANTLKTTPEQLAERFAADGVEFQRFGEIEAIKIRPSGSISALGGFEEGLFSVQDPTAGWAVRLFEPIAGACIVDLCAAPGGKTIQLAQAMADSGRIIATDIDSQRLRLVRENCQRLGVTMVKTVEYDDLGSELSRCGPVDGILLDVPCSNSGVLARRPEVRLRITPGAVKSLAAVQSGLLEEASKMVKTGGKVCYSTCSILRDENAEIIAKFLACNPEFRLDCEKSVLPSVGGEDTADFDGGYTAVLVKKS